MNMPLEVELLITAWDNAKKNAFEGEGMNIDPETGEVIDGTEIPSPLADLVYDIDKKMTDLVGYYNGTYEDEYYDDVAMEDDEVAI